MLYSTIVEKNDEGLMMIIDAATKFGQGCYMDAICKCNMKKNDIFKITECVRHYKAKLKMEHLALSEFAVSFPNQYATNNNECFDVANKLFNRIRSTISGSKNIYKKFCTTRKRNPQPSISVKRSVFTHSQLTSRYIDGVLDGMGMETFDQCVSVLYFELEDFFIELVNCLTLCREVIRDVDAIRSCPERCVPIYQQHYNEMVNNSKQIVRTFKENKIVPHVEMIERRNNARSFSSFVCENYHKINLGEFQNYVVASELEKGKTNGLTSTEVALFGADSIERVMRIRIVIEHFDELEPEGHKGKLKADCVASFMIWCGIGEGDNKVKSFVEDYFNATYRGAFLTVKFGAVNSAKNKQFLKKSSFDDQIFHQQIDALVAKYSGKGAQNTPKVANF